MALVNVDSVAQVGPIRDQPSYALDPRAWSLANNVRFRNGRVEPLRRGAPIFGPLPINHIPIFSMPLVMPDEGNLWLWASLSDVWIWNGLQHFRITRRVGVDIVPYTTEERNRWGGYIHGGIVVLNNGVDVPQSWPDINLAFSLQDLPNWPALLRARRVTGIGPYLVAIHLVDDGARRPHTVRWSHPSDPGSVPSSWDITNPTVDAGEYDLPDVESGVLMDALSLRNELYLYKQKSTWRMRHIGGRSIFAFERVFTTVGALAPRCVALTGNGMHHFLVTGDDIVVHDGHNMQSVVKDKLRSAVFNDLDPEQVNQSFVFTDTIFKECWFCYPPLGETRPRRALIWNYETGVPSQADIDFEWASMGPVGTERIWEQVEGVWADDPYRWNEPGALLPVTPTVGAHNEVRAREGAVGEFAIGQTSPAQLEGDPLPAPVPTAAFQHVRHVMIGARSSVGQPDFIVVNAGDPKPARLLREGLAIMGQKLDGSFIVDFNKVKFVDSFWPRLSPNSKVNVRVGAQERIEGDILWDDPVLFNSNLDQFLSTTVSGAAIAVEFFSTDTYWGLEGYKLEVIPVSDF